MLQKIKSWHLAIALPLLAALLLLVAQTGLGIFLILTVANSAKFAGMTVKCGHFPVITSNFAGSSDYWLPGEGTPSFVDTGYFCTEEEAVNAGYSISTLTPTGAARQAKLEAGENDNGKFKVEKLNYTAYVPSVQGIDHDDVKLDPQRTDHTDEEILYTLQKNGTGVADVREGRVGSKTDPCLDMALCPPTGMSTIQGASILDDDRVGWPHAPTYIIVLGQTYISINTETSIANITKNEAIEVFNSMKKID